MSFKNKVVLIIGGSDGIGAAAAVKFTEEEADVAIVGRNDLKLNNVSGLCEAVGKKPLAIKADITNDDEVRVIIDKTVNTYGKLDVLVNSAMFLCFGTITDGKALEAYDKTINTNLRSLIHVTLQVAPHLMKTKGNIVNLNGVGGQKTISPVFMSFCVAEAGRDHFTRLVALDLAPSGVRVNCVSAGPVRTKLIEISGFDYSEHLKDMTALGRISEPEEIADLVLFLASDKAKSITGAIYNIDNGMTLK